MGPPGWSSTRWWLLSTLIWPSPLSSVWMWSPWPWSSTWCQWYVGCVFTHVDFDCLGTWICFENFQLFLHWDFHNWSLHEDFGSWITEISLRQVLFTIVNIQELALLFLNISSCITLFEHPYNVHNCFKMEPLLISKNYSFFLVHIPHV